MNELNSPGPIASVFYAWEIITGRPNVQLHGHAGSVDAVETHLPLLRTPISPVPSSLQRPTLRPSIPIQSRQLHSFQTIEAMESSPVAGTTTIAVTEPSNAT